jgi:hypothetical protein
MQYIVMIVAVLCVCIYDRMMDVPLVLCHHRPPSCIRMYDALLASMHNA